MSLNLPLQKGGGDWNAVYEGSERAPVQGYAPLSDAAGVTVALAVAYGDTMDDRDAAIRDQIILAVNCHDELVVVARAFLDASSNKDGSWIGGYFIETDDLMKLHARARAALAKAIP